MEETLDEWRDRMVEGFPPIASTTVMMFLCAADEDWNRAEADIENWWWRREFGEREDGDEDAG